MATITLPLMKCGHTAQGTDSKTGAPVCVICFGICPGADEVADSPPSLEGRIARCPDCRREVPSSYGLAFFEMAKAPVCGDCKYGQHWHNEKASGKPLPYYIGRVCDEFTSPVFVDKFYCGCRGWD